MAWVIDRDYINTEEGDTKEVGTGVGTLEGETFRFRILDGDLIPYFGGKFDRDGMDNDEAQSGLYTLAMWAANTYGAPILEVRKDQEFGNKSMPGDWCPVY